MPSYKAQSGRRVLTATGGVGAGKFGRPKPHKEPEIYSALRILVCALLCTLLGAGLYFSQWRVSFFLLRMSVNLITLATIASAITLFIRYAISRSTNRLYLALTFAMTNAAIILLLVFLPLFHPQGEALELLHVIRSWAGYGVRCMFALLLTLSIAAEQGEEQESPVGIGLFAGGSVLILAGIYVALTIWVPPPSFTFSMLARSREVLPLLCYLTSLNMLLKRGEWKREKTLFELLFLVTLHAIATVYLVVVPTQLHALETAAYALMAAGFAIPFFSVQTSMYRSYRYAEEHRIKESWMTGTLALKAGQNISPVVFREIADQLNEGLAITDVNGNVVYANNYLAQMTGYAQDQLLNKNPSAWQHASMPADFYPRIFARIGQEKKMQEVQAQNASPVDPGQGFDVLTRITPVLNEFGDISCVVFQQRDISAEQQRLHLLRQMIDTMPLGVLLIEVPSLSITLRNAQAEYLLTSAGFDLTRTKTLDQIAALMKNVKKEPYVKEELPPYRVMQTRKSHDAEDIAVFLGDQVNPSMIWKMKATPFFFRNGRIQYVLVSFDDISRHREFEHQMSDFISVASHQLRTPLTSIKWSLDALRKKDLNLSQEDKDMMIQTGYEASERMMTTIQQLLQAAELERGNINASLEPMDLVKAVDDARKVLKMQIDEKKISVKQSVLRTIPPVRFNPFFLQQIVQNVLENAVRYTPEGGEIDSILTFKDDMVEWTLHDTGIGIPKENREKVFEKFFRSDNAQRMNPDGTGMGLYIVKSTMDSVGGAVWFDSEEGVGTTMYLRFPLVPQEKKGTKKEDQA